MPHAVSLISTLAVGFGIEVRQMAKTARTLNPAIAIAVRCHNSEEAALLEAEGTGKVFVGESELAKAMASHVETTVAAAGKLP